MKLMNQIKIKLLKENNMKQFVSNILLKLLTLDSLNLKLIITCLPLMLALCINVPIIIALKNNFSIPCKEDMVPLNYFLIIPSYMI